MPILNWSAASPSEIVTNHYWVYWAVTIPLTLLTMLVVSFWIVIRGKKNEAISEARESRWASKVVEVKTHHCLTALIKKKEKGK